MNTEQHEVIVVGGGPAGVCAAISAARLGAEVLLVEQYGCLGGMSTMGQVAPWMTFHDREGNQVIRGLGQEIVDRMVARGFSRGHVRDTMGETYSVTPIDNEGLKLVLAQMCREAGVRLLFHTFVFGCEGSGGRIGSLRAANKSGELELKAKVFVDATGDGDLFALAGCSLWVGREPDHLMQPCSMMFSMYGVDFEKVRRHMLNHPEDFHDKTIFSLIENDLPECVSGFFEEWARGCREMGLEIQRERILFFRGVRSDVACINTTRLTGVDSTNAESMSNAEVVLRQQVRDVADLLIRYVPGFEHAQLLSVSPVVGIREGRRLNGVYCISGDDLRAGRRFADDIAINGYPIDQHHPDGPGFTESAVPAYGVPYRALLTKEFGNLIVAGRCISCDREAQSSLRLTPCVLAVGQAAGTAAFLAAGADGDARRVDPDKLRALLVKNGAYLG